METFDSRPHTEAHPQLRVVVAEDDLLQARWLAACLSRHGWILDVVNDGQSAVATALRGACDVLLLDMQLPRLDGLQVLDAIGRLDAPPRVVLLSGYLDVRSTLFALERGVDEILEKPVPPRRLIEVVQRIEGELRARDATPAEDAHRSAPELIGRSAAMAHLRSKIASAASHRVAVLIMGETGTGKELIANAIHRCSGSASEPMIAVNCAAVHAELFESELFGHEPGSFTGARAERAGLFERAGRGTLFLDEVGEMPAAQQAKLLRVLETRALRRLGSDREKPMRARVIGATNRNLRGADGEALRPDLFYRLGGVIVRAPPLRERKSDIPSLALHFLRSLRDTRRYGPSELSPEACGALESHDWPGNVRELRAVVESSALRTTGDVLRVRVVVETLRERGCLSGTIPIPPPRPSAAESGLARPLPDVERDLVLSAFARSSGNLSEAARQLGIPRSTLRDKLRRYGAVR